MYYMYTDNEGIGMLQFIIDNILVEFKLSEPLAVFFFTLMRQSLYKNMSKHKIIAKSEAYNLIYIDDINNPNFTDLIPVIYTN